jgi:hypothetical protein
MAKEYLICLKEFEGLSEEKQITYMTRVGAYMTINTGTFPGVTYNGVAVSAAALSLSNKYAVRHATTGGMLAYTTQLGVCKDMMNVVYDEVNTISAGSGAIIELAGIKATSSNTTRIAKPAGGVGTVILLTGTPDELKIKWDNEKLSVGAIVITSNSTEFTVEITEGLQLKLTIGEIIIFINLTMGHSLIIDNLEGSTEYSSTLSLFNTNGFGNLVITPMTVVPNV